jgi:hypothetical protein
MSDLNKEIWKLKKEGMSLRGIATALGISHEAVRKRLKNLAKKEKVSTIQSEKVSTGSNARKLRACGTFGDTVNQVSTPKTLSLSPTPGVNPFKTSSLKATGGMKEVVQEVLSEVDSLSEQIKQFLENKGIEIYRMKVTQEAYQVKHKGQIVRLYVQRNKGETG